MSVYIKVGGMGILYFGVDFCPCMRPSFAVLMLEST